MPSLNKEKGYLETNKAWWNARVSAHLESEFYDLEGFLASRNSLQTHELGLLGDVQGKDVVHLQCHFGMDTLSLVEMGANVTGVDISDRAITAAKDLAQKMDLTANFICCDVNEAADRLQTTFDLVFTTYGVLGWLPDLNTWARNVRQLLKPGGRLVLVEFHPVVWMFDDAFKKIRYSYFNRDVIKENSTGYTENSAHLSMGTESWNHSLADVIDALINAGLHIADFREEDYSPYPCFDTVVEVEKGKHQITGLEGKIPMVYSIVAALP